MCQVPFSNGLALPFKPRPISGVGGALVAKRSAQHSDQLDSVPDCKSTYVDPERIDDVRRVTDRARQNNSAAQMFSGLAKAVLEGWMLLERVRYDS